MDVSSGRRIGQGRFEVLGRIGEGAAGVVYEVRDRRSDARLALKTVRGAGPEALVSLKREFRAVQDITHPNLVRLDELFEEDGAWFFTMELVDGKDWLSYVVGDGGRTFDAARLRASLVQIVEALAVLHAKGTMHRDVKPSNVLVSRGGQVKVLDFGIASGKLRITDRAGEGIVGTLAYMPPEQLLSEDPTPAGDFYAAGVMLHQALTGKLPYFDREADCTEEKLNGPPTPVREVAPGIPDDLATLCDALLRSEPGERPDAASILRVLGGAAAGSSAEIAAAQEEFVGRTRELAALREAFAAVRAGGTVAVVVEGASGLGKSALVRHFLHEVRDRALVLQGRCHEREYVPYKGVDAIVDDLAAYLGDTSEDMLLSLANPAMRLLPRLFPVLKRVPFFDRLAAGSLSMPEGDASELRGRIFGAFRELVALVGSSRPLVLAIDDIQWADGDSLALLSDLLAPPSPPPLLLVCTRRLVEEETDRESAPAPSATFAFPGDVRHVRIAGLSDDEISSLASRLSREAHLEEAEIRSLVKESGGHPLFLQELMRRRATGTEETPHLRLDDALWNRVVLLGSAERSLVEAIAVAGVPTSLESIASAAAITLRELPQHLGTLRGANLVKLSGNAVARRIEPYHDRVREAVVLHLDADARRAWHERLARVLDVSPERDVEQLAQHWEGAGDAARAADLFREAGERAGKAFAFDRAVEFYRRSLALDPGRGLDRAALELALADALFNAGRGGESGRAFLALAGSGLDRAALDLRVRAAKAFFGSGYFAEGVGAIRAVITAADLPFPQGRFSVIFTILWHRLFLRIRGLAFTPRDPATVSPGEVMRFDVCSAAAYGIGMADTIRGAVFQYLGARLALRLGDRSRATRGLCGLVLSMCTGGLKTARFTAEALEKARELNEGLDDSYLSGLVDGAGGFAAYMIDQWALAEQRLRAAEERFRDLRGVSYELATCRMLRGRTLLQLGRLRDLDAYVGPPLRDAVRRNDVYAIVNTRSTVSAILAIAHDDAATAEAELAEATRIIATYAFQMQHVYGLFAGCALDLYRGAPESTLARLDARQADLRASLLERVQSVRVALVSLRARAHLALAAREPGGRAAHLAQAQRGARQLGREGLPGAAAHSRLLQAAIASIGGDAAEAVLHLRGAAELYDDRAMGLHAAAARHALGGLLGGDEGREMGRAALVCFEAQGVVAPLRYAQHYAPGFGR